MPDTVSSIRKEFLRKYLAKEIVTNDTGSLSGADTIEIVGASFIADEASIFGKPNYAYIQNEIDWYISKSLYVADIPGETPKIWQAVSSNEGKINSNYGYLIFDKANGSQALRVIDTLVRSPQTRQAVMVYTRPSIHHDYNVDGMSDFICTNSVQYLIRDGALDVVVNMRSNDIRHGYLNDLAWQLYVQAFVRDQYMLRTGIFLDLGKIHWQVGSLHIYEKSFYLLDHYAKTGEINISLKDYNKLYAK